MENNNNINEMNNTKNGGRYSNLSIAALILTILGCTSFIGLILAIIDLTNKNGTKKTLSKISLIICGFNILLLIGIMGMRKDTNTNKKEITTETVIETTTEEDASINEALEKTNDKIEPNFENNIIVTDDCTIEITNYKVIQPGENGNAYGDKPIIEFTFNVTNTSGNSMTANECWAWSVNAYQDNNDNYENELDLAITLDNDENDEARHEQIKEGGTVESNYQYTLTDLETPVELRAKNGLFGGTIGSQTFDIK